MASAAVQSAPVTESAFQHVSEPSKPTTTASTTSKTDTHPTTNEPKPSSHPIPAPSPHHVTATLNYYLDPPDGGPPAPTYVDRPETYERPTVGQTHVIHDITGEEHLYTLDRHGFQVIEFTTREREFNDDEKIREVYYPDVERALKEVTGATLIHIFDHTIRRPASKNTSSTTPRGPVTRVHIDQSPRAALSRVTHHLPHLPHLLSPSTRIQLINLWYPLRPIHRSPLALASASSVPAHDLVPIPLIYPNRAGETLAVRPNEAHRWFYKHRLGEGKGEAVLIKCFDGWEGRDLDGDDGGKVAGRVPHTAFVDEYYETPEWPERESIEVRALVFTEGVE